jgi:hypothetical protein
MLYSFVLMMVGIFLPKPKAHQPDKEGFRPEGRYYCARCHTFHMTNDPQFDRNAPRRDEEIGYPIAGFVIGFFIWVFVGIFLPDKWTPIEKTLATHVYNNSDTTGWEYVLTDNQNRLTTQTLTRKGVFFTESRDGNIYLVKYWKRFSSPMEWAWGFHWPWVEEQWGWEVPKEKMDYFIFNSTDQPVATNQPAATTVTVDGSKVSVNGVAVTK